MALDDLLATLERRNSVTPVTPATPAGVQPKPLQHKACTLVTPVTPENTNSGSNALQVGATDTAATFDQEWHEERAAIYEFDAGLSREEAERRAYLEVMNHG
jgi:hypothetical protein